jgi:hypothetical protein
MEVKKCLDKHLTILIPTFNRAPKLRRFLIYLLEIESHYKTILNNVVFVIADGSDSVDKKNIQLVEQLKSLGLFVECHHLPGEGLKERYIIMSNMIKTSHVLVCGDDDLVDFEGVKHWLENKNSYSEEYIYAGRFSNIKGLSIFGLEIDCLERPYYGFEISSENAETRVLMYGVSNAFGITSLSYAIQPTSTFQEFWNITKDRQLYYGGIEFLHQTFLSVRSKIIFSKKTLIYRDFTYIGYQPEDLREAPATDKYPYIGEESVNLAIQIISKYSFLDASRAEDIVKNILSVQTSVSQSKERLQYIYKSKGHKICSECDLITLDAVRSVWFQTYLRAYPAKGAIKKFINLSLPPFILECYSKIKVTLQS